MCIRDSTRRCEEGFAGYAHESIGDALMEFLGMKESDRASYSAQKAQQSERDGFMATLMAEASHASLARGKELSNGQVYLGKTIDVNDYITEKLGSNADEYLVKSSL